MHRRTFFRQLLSSIGITVAAPATPADKSAEVLIQDSPVAGFQFHSGEDVWPDLCVGDDLNLRRETENVHDPYAVAIYRGTDKLGYVPRGENSSIAQMMDRGEDVVARISSLTGSENPWERIQVAISLVRN